MKLMISLISTLVLLMATAADTPRSEKSYFFNYENVLGTSFMLKVNAETENNALEAETAALDEIDRLSSILNSYDPDSEFSRWQKTNNEDIIVSPELFEVFSLFEKWQTITGGALTASVGTASGIWKRADDEDVMPSAEELEKAAAGMQKQHWAINGESGTVRHLTDDPLVFNTFVKSYIINKASEKVMEVDGISSSVLNIGGDMVAAGNTAEEIGIADPVDYADNKEAMATIKIADKAVATSGNYQRGFLVGDEWFSHIIDPHTAMPVKDVISATVVAENAADAGALATAFNILPAEESIRLAGQTPGTEFMIVTREGERIESEGWKDLEKESGAKGTAAAADYELSIEFEITRFMGRSPRPYIAVWIENENAEPVRTLALWFNNYRWLPDLRRWYAKNYEKAQQYEFMQTITSATRSAGKYTLIWDGNDNDGKALKQGTYTVYIEASREHGTYQLMRKEIELNKKPQRIDLEGGVEISCAAIDYHKVDKNKASL